MSDFVVKILDIEKITHDVNRYLLERPEGYYFIPGQATDVSINTPDLKKETRPFTFTGLVVAPYLEFTIKSYEDHNGITKKLKDLKPGSELIIRDVWGAINYKGPGVFIAGGAGVTPFIAIFRELKNKKNLAGNKLLFSNKTEKDIILKNEFSEMLGNNFINLLTREKNDKYYFGRIGESFLKMYITDFTQNFYVCGPDSFVQEINTLLERLGAKHDSIIFEK